MSVHTSTVTSKGQTTVPEPIRTALGLEVGKLLVWELTQDNAGKGHLTVRPSPELDALAGCLKSQATFAGIEHEKRAARKARIKGAAGREKLSLRR